MSKKQRVTIPPLQISPTEQQSIKDLMSRMRGPSLPADTRKADDQLPAKIDAQSPTIADAQELENSDTRSPADTSIQTPIAVNAQLPAVTGVHAEPFADTFETDTGIQSPAENRLEMYQSPALGLADTRRQKGSPLYDSDRHRTPKTRLVARVDPPVAQRFKHFALDAGLEIQEFIELACLHFMSCPGVRREGGQTPHDDLMIFSTADDIITLYFSYTENRWKPADDREAKRYNKVDRILIELGILETYINLWHAKPGQRINSFKYFCGQIDQWVDTGQGIDANVYDGILKKRRQQFEKKKQEFTKGK